MRKADDRKKLVYGIIILLIGLNLTPSITGKRNDTFIELFQKSRSSFTDETVSITDWAEDVCTLDFYTGNNSIVMENPYIEVENLDIISALFKQEGKAVTVQVQVAGIIEDRGGWPDPYNYTDLLDLIEYDFGVITSEQEYYLSYSNNTGFLEYNNQTFNVSSSNFTVDGDTLSMTFSLINETELYKDFTTFTTYIRINLSDPYDPDITFLDDMAPNPPMTKAIFIGLIRDTLTRQDYIIFNPIYVTTIRFMPLNISRAPTTPIMISKQRLGFIGHHVIIGFFNVADSFFFNTVSSSHFQRIFNRYVTPKYVF
jgi:hypothetical protein